MDVVLGFIRQRHVHDKRQAFYVKAPCSQIGADEEPDVTIVERLDDDNKQRKTLVGRESREFEWKARRQFFE